MSTSKTAPIQFKPFVTGEFMEFKQRSVKDYSQALILSGKSTEENALKDAMDEYDGILPQGNDTENHHLNHIAKVQGENVGYIWFEIRSEYIFICEFRIYESHRGKGLARQTLFELEQIAKAKSVPAICLHVFEDNIGLQEFYKHMGYEITSTKPGSCWMQKLV